MNSSIDMLDNNAAQPGCLDARGLNCPLPLLKLKMALKSLAVNDTLQVLTTDKGSLNDIETYCRLSEHQLLKVKAHPSYFEFLVQKG